jgi:hypothetical protein
MEMPNIIVLNARSCCALNVALVGTGIGTYGCFSILTFNCSNVFDKHVLMDSKVVLEMEQELAFIPTGTQPPCYFYGIFCLFVIRQGFPR